MCSDIVCKFSIPSNVLLCGPTGCGKSSFMENLIENPSMWCEPMDSLWLCYGIYTENVKRFAEKYPQVRLIEGLPLNLDNPQQMEFFWNSFRILSEFFQNSFGILSEFFRNSFRILSEFFQNSFGIVSEFFRNSFGILAEFLWNSCRILVKFLQNSCGILAEFLWNSCGILAEF